MAKTKENPRVLAHGLAASHHLHSLQISMGYLVYNLFSWHSSAFACAPLFLVELTSKLLHPTLLSLRAWSQPSLSKTRL